MANTHKVSFKLNGKGVEVAVEPRELLIHTLRENSRTPVPTWLRDLALRRVHGRRGWHVGQGLHRAHGAVRWSEMLTVEGLEQEGVLHALQQAFHEEHGLQCGFCTPGMLTRAYRLLQENPNPTEQEIRFGISATSAAAPDTRTSSRPCNPPPASWQPRPASRPRQFGSRSHEALTQYRPETLMGDQSELQEREQKLQGMGTSLLRKEDAKFIRGQGTYVDDIKLPGMLFGALVRSPYAHARIKGIDKAKRWLARAWSRC
jgi:aerobic-type carbon monoxide dehydrogenase small subunit (CoxS/CutS family)